MSWTAALARRLSVVGPLVAVVACGPRAPEPARMPADLVARNNTGVGLMGRFEYGPAHDVFAALAAQAPGQLDVQVNLAIATLNRQREGDEAAAQTILERVLQADPQHLRAHYCLGLLLLNAGRPQEALPHFALVARARATDAYAAYYVAQCAFRQGDFARALDGFQRAGRLDPHLRSAAYGAFQSLQRLGRGAEAQESLRAFQDLEGNPQSRNVEFTYTRMGPLAEAATIDAPGAHAAAGAGHRVGPPFAAAASPLVTADLPDGWRWRSEAGPRPASITAADIDGDGRIDLFIASALQYRGRTRNAVLLNRGDEGFELDVTHPLAAVSDVNAALWGDYDNDGLLDVYLCRHGANQLWRQTAGGRWADVTTATRTAGSGGNTVDGAMFDADHDGDLDLFLVTADGPNDLLNNNGDGTFRSIGRQAGLAGDGRPSTGIIVADLDGDRDLDVIVLKAQPPHDVFFNDRVWRYHRAAGFERFAAAPVTSAIAADLDADGRVELYTSDAEGVTRWTRDGAGAWASSRLGNSSSAASASQLAAADVDGDGHLELVAGTPDGRWSTLAVPMTGPIAVTGAGEAPAIAGWALALIDPAAGPSLVGVPAGADAGEAPVVWAPGPGRARFAALAFTGRDSRSDQRRSNTSGIGAGVAVRVDSRWTAFFALRPQSGPGQSLQPTAVGTGSAASIDFVSINWSDGVLQTELALDAGKVHRIEEKQRQLSSCPVLFAYDGTHFAFVTDVLGVGGIGFFERPGRYSPPRPREHLLLPDGLPVAAHGVMQLKITEPMEEVTYLDRARLVAYDLPPGWRMTVDERREIEGPVPTGDARFFTRERLPVDVTTDTGEHVTAAVTRVDGVAAPPGRVDPRFIGRTDERTLTLRFESPIDDGPGEPMLVADGWIEYPYAQTIFAAWQAGAPYRAPSLDALGADGAWHVVQRAFGYPGGMPRQMSLPLRHLPRGTTALRLRTTQEVYWDRLAIAYAAPAPQVVSQALPLRLARLASTGFATRTTAAFRRPSYDYDARVPLWDTRHLAGFYTAEGRVDELVAAEDGAVAIFGPGEEIHLEFAAPAIPAPAGWTRRYVLELRGWCKDMDLYTEHAETVEPVPYGVIPSAVRERLHAKYNTRYASGF